MREPDTDEFKSLFSKEMQYETIPQLITPVFDSSYSKHITHLIQFPANDSLVLKLDR